MQMGEDTHQPVLELVIFLTLRGTINQDDIKKTFGIFRIV